MSSVKEGKFLKRLDQNVDVYESRVNFSMDRYFLVDKVSPSVTFVRAHNSFHLKFFFFSF